jgi:hypothetical protein
MAKKRASKARLADIERRIEVQRRRAARPTLPVNAHAPVTKSFKEKKESLERKDGRRRRWDEE